MIEERTREAQRLEKLLEDAGIKLSYVATDILGVSGRAMLQALVAGVRDPQLLAELAKGRLRAKLPNSKTPWSDASPHHGLLVSEMLARIDAADTTIGRLSAEISRLVAPYAAVLELLQTIPGVHQRTAEVILVGDQRKPGMMISDLGSGGHLVIEIDEGSPAAFMPGGPVCGAGRSRRGHTSGV